MDSISFPKMFNKTSTNLKKDLDATKQNTLLLLKTEEGEFFGDPYFGIKLKRYLFNQNNVILRDILIDEIYIKIATFMPQVKINRKDIKLIFDMGRLYCNITVRNLTDFQLNTYNLILYDENQSGE